MPTTARPLLTLSDVAALAGVQRPAVSTWRTRPRVRGVVVPFPEPVHIVGGVEHFAADDISAYLARTRRGNNPDATIDAAAYGPPLDGDVATAEVLLTLAALTGEEVAALTASELTALATQVDPSDDFLLREVQSGDWPLDLPVHVDELLAASLGADDALHRLEAGRLARRTAERGCTDALVALVSTVADACRAQLGSGTALSPSGVARLDRALAPLFERMQDADRAFRRRAALLGAPAPATDPEAPVVRVRSLLGHQRDDVLREVDDVVLGLGPRDVALVVGAAGPLTDRLTGVLERHRAATLRPGPLVAALRLPRGMWKGAHRQSAALWVLAGGAPHTQVRLADLDQEVVDLADLAVDVGQALAPRVTGSQTEARSYRYLRTRALAALLVGGPLVQRGVRAVRRPVGADPIDSVVAAAAVLGVGVLPEVRRGPGGALVRTASLGELADEKRLVLRHGCRVDPDDAESTGTVRVLGTDLRLDPVDAQLRYPRAARTAPGDVVFAEKPPWAIVDTTGGSLVAAPARLLRLTDTAPVRPNVLAARINRAAPGSEWRTWEVPVLPEPERTALDDALARAAAVREDLQRRCAAVDHWTDAVTGGAASGALTFPDPDENR